MSVNDRIKDAIKWLIGNGVAANQAELGKLMGYTNESAFSKVVNGKVSLPSSFTYKLCKLDKSRTLNETWVSEGWGQMIDKSRSFLSEEEREQFTKSDINIENTNSTLPGVKCTNPDCLKKIQQLTNDLKTANEDKSLLKEHIALLKGQIEQLQSEKGASGPEKRDQGSVEKPGETDRKAS